MGFDAFGLPAEQHAVSTGEHPSLITRRNCDLFRTQLKRLGFSYDWNLELATCDKEYYKWTQWIFLLLYNSWFDIELNKARPIETLAIPPEITEQGLLAIQNYQAAYRLAYYSEALVNFCPALGTVLANEEVIDGKSERGGHDVIRKPMKQWMLRITAYAERLLAGLDTVDWPENIKEQQRHWIGRKEGANVTFSSLDGDTQVTVFTTRPDTLFGVTFLALAPENSLVTKFTTDDQCAKVTAYQKEASHLSDITRTLENRKKTGVWTGSFVINPLSGEQVPVYVADYVLFGYGTGAVMGVPAHDERDFEFARTFDIAIKPVILPKNTDEETIQDVIDGEDFWEGSGTMLPLPVTLMAELGLVNMPNEQAGKVIVSWLEANNYGEKVVQYKLRDWLFSRQRYWGEPIPIIHWQDGRVTSLDAKDLPLLLPQVEDYKPSEGGESPLSKVSEWVNVVDPITGVKGTRETNTMPQWAGSCWYYLRFIDPQNTTAPWDENKEKTWMPVDLYVGGAEHAVLHLLYSRFWHKVLFDLGFVSTEEPFQKLFNQGMIVNEAFRNKKGSLVPTDKVIHQENGDYIHRETGEKLEKIIGKMSKSLRNVIDPLEVVKEYGADTLRTYLLFMGPLDATRPWDSKAITGNFRFLKRAFNFVTDKGKGALILEEQESSDTRRVVAKTIKRVTVDLEALRFNTAISALMEFVNKLQSEVVSKTTLSVFVRLLSPFAPHLAEELWEQLGNEPSVAYAEWPTYDPSLLLTEEVTVVIQIEGKKRGVVTVPREIDEVSLRQHIVAAMSTTQYQVKDTDTFVIVYQKDSKVPKLVNIMLAT
jgi:leucyl-tRNA synthetase